jgi:hypothetical protein
MRTLPPSTRGNIVRGGAARLFPEDVVQNRVPGDRDPEVLSEPTAARLLARASELDELRRAGSTVAELRAAAAEAGISAPAFEAALTELQAAGQAPLPDVKKPPRPRSRLRTLAAGGMVALVFVSTVLFFRGGAAEPPARMVEESILLRCLSPSEAADLVRPLLRTNGGTAASDRAGRNVLTISATPEQLERVRSTIAEHEREGSIACTIRPAPSATP